jgi:hypothetical protein
MVFYGGDTDPAKSLLVDVGAGLTVTADISIEPGRTRSWHIRGVAIEGATGQPLAGFVISALPVDPSASRVVLMSARSDEQGRFDIPGVTPGRYWVRSGFNRMAAGVLVEVGNADLEGVRYVRNRSFRISGRVVIEGREGDLDAGTLRLGLANAGEGGAEASLKPDGTFTISANLEDGDYRFVIAPILRSPSAVALQQSPAIDGSSAFLQNAYVKSIRSGEGDILNQPFTLRNLSDNPVMVIINTNGGVIEGRVISERQELVGRAFVALIPASPVPVSRRPDRYKSAFTDAAGRFRISALPPGEYKLLAFEEFTESGLWMTPEFANAYEGRTHTIRISEGGKEVVEVTAIRVNR